MLTTPGRDAFLGVIRDTNHWVGLMTAVTNWRTPTVTEASYTGYARVQVTATTGWNAPADTAVTPQGRRISNVAEVAFPQNTGVDQTVIAWGLWTASSGGTLRLVVPLDDDPPVLGTAASTGELITAPAHGLAADQRVFALGVPGAAFPTGLVEGTAYWVRSAGLTADVFSVSTTQGGAAVDITANGAALFIPYKAVTIAANATPRFAAGAFEIAI